jgi:hypothetical protein
LKSIPEIEVYDYRQSRNLDSIAIEHDKYPRIYQLAPWQLPKVNGNFEAFMNLASFQEMERETCSSYADLIKPMVKYCVLLLNLKHGHAFGAGGQKHPITMDFLLNLFFDAFPSKIDLNVEYFDPLLTNKYEAVLLTRNMTV